jgi:hypothetical protein
MRVSCSCLGIVHSNTIRQLDSPAAAWIRPAYAVLVGASQTRMHTEVRGPVDEGRPTLVQLTHVVWHTLRCAGVGGAWTGGGRFVRPPATLWGTPTGVIPAGVGPAGIERARVGGAEIGGLGTCPGCGLKSTRLPSRGTCSTCNRDSVVRGATWSPGGSGIAVSARKQGIRRTPGSGEGGIRTHGALSDTPVFKTGAFNRSATSPEDEILIRPYPAWVARPDWPIGFSTGRRKL